MCQWPLSIYSVPRKQAKITQFPQKSYRWTLHFFFSLSLLPTLSLPVSLFLICKVRYQGWDLLCCFWEKELCVVFCHLCTFLYSLTLQNHQHLSLKTLKSWRHYFKNTCGDLCLLRTLFTFKSYFALPARNKIELCAQLHIECFPVFIPGPGVRRPGFESWFYYLPSGGFLAS